MQRSVAARIRRCQRTHRPGRRADRPPPRGLAATASPPADRYRAPPAKPSRSRERRRVPPAHPRAQAVARRRTTSRRFTAHRLSEERSCAGIARRPQHMRELHASAQAASSSATPPVATAALAIAQVLPSTSEADALRAVGPRAVDGFRRTRCIEAEVLRLRAGDRPPWVGNAEDALRLVEQAIFAMATAAPPTPRAADEILVTGRHPRRARRHAVEQGRLEARSKSYAEALVIYRALGMARQEAARSTTWAWCSPARRGTRRRSPHYKSGQDDRRSGALQSRAKLCNIGPVLLDSATPSAPRIPRKALQVEEMTGGHRAVAEEPCRGAGQAAARPGPAALDQFERGRNVANAEPADRYQEVARSSTSPRPPRARATAQTPRSHGDDHRHHGRADADWRVGSSRPSSLLGLACPPRPHDEAIACGRRRCRPIEGARPDGDEHIHRGAPGTRRRGQTDAEPRPRPSSATRPRSPKAAKLHEPAAAARSS